ncbi:DUF6807 family protein [Actomonas aquatica]|uniref:DUF6807 family protein n=1 Tax=Actomonas aquatica TaxID=2866162 RepID=A0ABZ1CDU0_9BACT|nr:DUF6807 family protein [Opitutus sp. WL0086]WRQ89582.1 DUF6807 family protein [Opitutus sp. WL0086]
MSRSLELRQVGEGSCAVALTDGPVLWHYQYQPDTPAAESPRPFIHPLYSIDGDVLTNWRPNDHPWHHGLSLTLTVVNDVNFWGGPSHRAADGYQWREDQGVQEHAGWVRQLPGLLVETVLWRDPRQDGRVLIEEERALATDASGDGWSLRWTSQLRNVSGEPLTCHNYHSLGGLEGSHYTGLQFRGARGLLDQHGDETVGLVGESGVREAAALHGQPARWLEWHTQHDGSLRRTKVRFTSPTGPIPWFVRPADPLVAFAPHREQTWVLAVDETRELDHLMHFQRA